jgi:hypothetical protein
MATGWTAAVRSQAGEKDFSLIHSVKTGFGAHPASYPMGTGGALSPGVKRQKLEADH